MHSKWNRVVGTSQLRNDAIDKVTGKAIFKELY